MTNYLRYLPNVYTFYCQCNYKVMILCTYTVTMHGSYMLIKLLQYLVLNKLMDEIELIRHLNYLQQVCWIQVEKSIGHY